MELERAAREGTRVFDLGQGGGKGESVKPIGP